MNSISILLCILLIAHNVITTMRIKKICKAGDYSLQVFIDQSLIDPEIACDVSKAWGYTNFEIMISYDLTNKGGRGRPDKTIYKKESFYFEKSLNKFLEGKTFVTYTSKLPEETFTFTGCPNCSDKNDIENAGAEFPNELDVKEKI